MTAVDLFQYEGQDVRTVLVDDEPWFVASNAPVVPLTVVTGAAS